MSEPNACGDYARPVSSGQQSMKQESPGLIHEECQKQLQRAIYYNGSIEEIKALIDLGADTDAIDSYGNTMLMWAAAENSHIDVLKLLLKRSAESLLSKRGKDRGIVSLLYKECLAEYINIRNKDGETALWNAAYSGKKENMQLLIENGADVNIQRDDGYTILMWAALNADVKIIELLLNNADVNIDIKESEGRTALDLAYETFHEGRSDEEILSTINLLASYPKLKELRARRENEIEQDCDIFER